MSGERDDQVIALGDHVESMRLAYEAARAAVYADGRRQALEAAAHTPAGLRITRAAWCCGCGMFLEGNRDD